MTTWASWYGKEKAGEQGDLKTKDPRGPTTGLGRARPVLQAAVFMGSSYLGQRGSHKAGGACALQWMACVCWSERTSVELNNQGCFSHSPHWEFSELHAPSSPLMNSEDSYFHVIAVQIHYYLNKWNQSIYIHIYVHISNLHSVEMDCKNSLRSPPPLDPAGFAVWLCNTSLLHASGQALWLALANTMRQKRTDVTFQSLGVKGLCTRQPCLRTWSITIRTAWTSLLEDERPGWKSWFGSAKASADQPASSTPPRRPQMCEPAPPRLLEPGTPQQSCPVHL